LDEVAAQEAPEVRHLVARAPPVLRREREERQLLEAEPRGVARDRAHTLGADAVPLDARQPAGFRPPTVPVHDDRDVSRGVGHGRANAAPRRAATLTPPA